MADKTARKQPARGKQTSLLSKGGEVWDDPTFPDRVRGLFSSCDRISAGSLHLIGLIAIRRHFGDRWPKVEQRVHAVIRDVIQRRVSDKDVFSRFLDRAYVVLFSELPLEKAQLKCALIAEEVSKRLFGDGGGLEIEVATAEIRPKEAGVKVEQVFSDDLLRRLVIGDGHIDSTRDVQVPPKAGRDKGKAWSKKNASLFPPDGPDRLAPQDDGPLHFVYRPMWLVRKDVISAHMALPARIGTGGGLLLGGSAMPSGKAGHSNAAFDHLGLETVAGALAELERSGRRRPVVLPVHFSTLNHLREWQVMLGRLQTMSSDQLKNLVIEVIGLHGAEPSFRLLEVIGLIAGMCRAVLVRIRFDHPSLEVFRANGVYAVGVDLGGIRMPETDLRAAMERLVERADAIGLRTFAHGIHSTSLLSTAVATGFRYLDGDAVATVVEAPTDNRHYTIADIYSLAL